MEQKISLRNFEDDKEEERQPLNAMVAKNLKEIIIQRIYKKDIETNLGDENSRLSPVGRQYLTALGPIIASLSCGMAAGYSAILLPQLMEKDTEIVITKSQGSWIASLMALPLIIGCLFSGQFLDYLGRKYSVVGSCIPLTIGWFVIAVSPDVTGLYIGRFITGFSVSLITPVVQVYIAETSQPNQRGILLSGSPLAVAGGILLSHVFGTFLTWRTTAWICSTPTMICMLILPFVKESPAWLIQKGKTKEAEEAFTWFRGNSESAKKEFRNLVSSNQKTNDGEQEGLAKFKMCLKPSFLKPFFILIFFFFVQQFSGVNAVAFYSVAILKKVMSNLNEYVSTLLIDVVRLIASLMAVILLKRFGRKHLAVTSAIGTSISLFLLSLYLICVNPERESFASTNLTDHSITNLSTLINETSAFLEQEISSRSISMEIVGYLPLVFLISYICFISLGLVPLPWVLTGEFFSKEMRGVGSGVSSSFGFLCFFIVVKCTPDLFENLNDYGTFCLFGVIAVVGSVVLGLFLPETKDKTLLEIEAYFDKSKQAALKAERNYELSQA